MTGSLSPVLRRAKDIFQTEGLIPLLGRSFDFVRRWFFEYGDYYLYEHTLKETNEADFMPRIHDLTFKIIHNNQEADELAATTGFDIRRRFANARNSLDKGAIAFCFFVEGEIAHIGWVALSEEAKKTLDSLPLKVDFSNNEAYVSSVETIPEYRGKGLMTYGYFKRQQFLREKGMIASRYAVAVSNVARQRAGARIDPEIYGRARYIKILWWKFWKEIPLTQTGYSE